MAGIGRWKAGLAFLALAAFAKTLVFAALVPLWQGPDEPVHFAYLQFIAEEKAFPAYRMPFESYRTDLPADVRQSVAAMEADAVAFHPDNIQTFLYQPGTWPLPRQGRTVDGANYHNAALGYSPLYYLYGALFYHAEYDADTGGRAFAARTGTALLIVPFTQFCFGLGRLLLGNRAAAFAFAAFASFHPALSFVFGIVNNDAMLVTCAAGAAYFTAAWITRGGLRTAMCAGLFAGLAVLAKPQGLFLLAPIAAVAALRMARRGTPGLRESLGAAGLFAAVAAPWFAFCAARYGHPLGPGFLPLQEIAHKYPPHTLFATLTPLFFRWPYTMFVSFWGNFGHLDTPIPMGLARALWYAHIAALAAVAGAVAFLAARGRLWRRQSLLFLGTLLGVAALDVLFALFFYNSIMYEGGQGRYYLAAWPLMAGALFFSLKTFTPPRQRMHSYFLLAAAMVLFCLYAAYAVIMPRYYL